MSDESKSERRRLETIGTAGHIDHGKTALVKALSGIDTDRLPEEQRRGISIDLGFAHFMTPSGREVGIVDVPGHERFIRNMVAGVWGIRAFLLVIAADEGIMPQTREHRDILELLGIDTGLVVMSKCDLVDAQRRAATREAIRAWFAESGAASPARFEGRAAGGAIPILETAIGEPESIARVMTAIERLLDSLPDRAEGGLFRLPIDRAFTLKGHGTIVTGTVAAGTLRAGDSIEILPDGIASRVRSLHAFDRPVEKISAGQRAALNLPDVSLAQIRRGALCAVPGACRASSLVDVRLRLLRGLPRPASPLKSGTRVRFFSGTREVGGRMHLLEGKQLAEGGTALAQMRFDKPVAFARGDRFLVRLDGPPVTIGGGEILDPAPPRHRKGAVAAARLAAVEQASPKQLVLAAVRDGRLLFHTIRSLATELALPEAEVFRALEEAEAREAIGRRGDWIFDASRVEREGRRLVEALDEFHEKQSTAAGADRLALGRGPFAAMGEASFDQLVATLVEKGQLTMKQNLIARAGWRPRVTSKLEAPAREVGRRLEAAPEIFLGLRALESDFDLMRHEFQELIKFLTATGVAVKVGPELILSKANHGRLLEKALSVLRRRGKAGTAELKEALGLSRKYLIPFLEHLDETGVTARTGNDRVLRGGSPRTAG